MLGSVRSIIRGQLTSVFHLWLLGADVAKKLDLVDQSVIEGHNIFGLYIGCPVLLEQRQFISYQLQVLQYRLLVGIEGKRDGGGIRHGEKAAGICDISLTIGEVERVASNCIQAVLRYPREFVGELYC